MKKIFIPVAMFLAASTAVTSCKKDDDTSKSRHEMFEGSWKLYQSGEDENGNGIWDANEKVVDSDAELTLIVFKGDGTGSLTGEENGVPMTSTLTWNLQNGDKDLRLINTMSGAPDTIIQNVVSIDASTLVLKDPQDLPFYFVSFNKQ